MEGEGGRMKGSVKFGISFLVVKFDFSLHVCMCC